MRAWELDDKGGTVVFANALALESVADDGGTQARWLRWSKSDQCLFAVIALRDFLPMAMIPPASLPPLLLHSASVSVALLTWLAELACHTVGFLGDDEACHVDDARRCVRTCARRRACLSLSVRWTMGLAAPSACLPVLRVRTGWPEPRFPPLTEGGAGQQPCVGRLSAGRGWGGGQ